MQIIRYLHARYTNDWVSISHLKVNKSQDRGIETENSCERGLFEIRGCKKRQTQNLKGTLYKETILQESDPEFWY